MELQDSGLPKELIRGFSNAGYGNMSFKWCTSAEVKINRLNFLSALSLNPQKGVTSELVHGDHVARVDESLAGFGILELNYKLQADGLITNKPGLFLMHVVGDCASITLYDPEHNAIGLAHSGWRGTNLHLPEKIVQRMKEEFGTDPDKLRIEIGPSIHKCCYAHVDHAVLRLPEWKQYLQKDNFNNWHVNILQFILDQLINSGVRPAFISTSDICTAHSPGFYSNYRDKKNGEAHEKRFAAIIGWRPKD